MENIERSQFELDSYGELSEQIENIRKQNRSQKMGDVSLYKTNIGHDKEILKVRNDKLFKQEGNVDMLYSELENIVKKEESKSTQVNEKSEKIKLGLINYKNRLGLLKNLRLGLIKNMESTYDTEPFEMEISTNEDIDRKVIKDKLKVVKSRLNIPAFKELVSEKINKFITDPKGFIIITSIVTGIAVLTFSTGLLMYLSSDEDEMEEIDNVYDQMKN
jgi:hypothetical protein